MGGTKAGPRTGEAFSAGAARENQGEKSGPTGAGAVSPSSN